MLKVFKLLIITAVMLALWISAFAAGPDITGTWIGRTEVPGQGLDELTMALKKGETGFIGTLVDTLGMIAKDTEIKDLKIDGANISFNFALVDGASVAVKLAVTSDKMKGSWEHQEGSTGALEFEKKK